MTNKTNIKNEGKTIYESYVMILTVWSAAVVRKMVAEARVVQLRVSCVHPKRNGRISGIELITTERLSGIHSFEADPHDEIVYLFDSSRVKRRRINGCALWFPLCGIRSVLRKMSRFEIIFNGLCSIVCSIDGSR